VYGENDEVTLDAYTAIGGPSDKSGHIDGQVLVRIIKEEFDLPIDIEELIRSVDDSGNGEIEYEEFEKMLKDKSTIKMSWNDLCTVWLNAQNQGCLRLKDFSLSRTYMLFCFEFWIFSWILTRLGFSDEG
jgi:hypothetical protein